MQARTTKVNLDAVICICMRVTKRTSSPLPLRDMKGNVETSQKAAEGVPKVQTGIPDHLLFPHSPFDIRQEVA